VSGRSVISFKRRQAANSAIETAGSRGNSG
jgi:hypothetical protein